MTVAIAAVTAFIAAAFYYALRYPNGKVFPSRRDKLLRKVGPLATGRLEDVRVRFYTVAGGVNRVTLAATYAYDVRGERFSVTLPTDSAKLPGPGIREALTVREFDRDVPERVVLDDGTLLDGRETIRVHFLDALRQRSPEVQVLYSSRKPGLSTVRDWR